MAGHSQFKNIMYRKGAQDKKRAKVFTKIIRELTTAARTGLPDPAANSRLRAAALPGPPGQHAEGYGRSGHQARLGGRRGRGLRGSAIRGLWSGWGRGHRRGFDR